MSAASTQTSYAVPVHDLTTEAFAPYGQVIWPRAVIGQFVNPNYDPMQNPDEAQLTLNGNGDPRLWIMQLPRRGLVFDQIARHRRVTQCLGALEGKDWLIGVAPPDHLGDDAKPRLRDIVGFRVPGNCVIKLHIATWHAGPHFEHEQCMFFNLENMSTRERDFHGADLGTQCRFAV